MDKLFSDLEKHRNDFISLMMKWANLDPRTHDMYDTSAAFNCIHDNSKLMAAERFIGEAFELLEGYRIAAQPNKDLATCKEDLQVQQPKTRDNT